MSDASASTPLDTLTPVVRSCLRHVQLSDASEVGCRSDNPRPVRQIVRGSSESNARHVRLLAKRVARDTCDTSDSSPSASRATRATPPTPRQAVAVVSTRPTPRRARRARHVRHVRHVAERAATDTCDTSDTSPSAPRATRPTRPTRRRAAVHATERTPRELETRILFYRPLPGTHAPLWRRAHASQATTRKPHGCWVGPSTRHSAAASHGLPGTLVG